MSTRSLSVAPGRAPGHARSPLHIRSRAGYGRRRAANAIMLAFTGLMTLVALAVLVWIAGYVVLRGAPSINFAFFTQLPRPMGVSGGGVLHAIEGTLILTALAGLFAVPPGLLAAFYLAQYPDTALGTALRFGTDVLSGVPSIVVGLFAYTLVVRAQGHFSALAGGVALAVLMLPSVIRTTEEMLKLVPRNLREGSLALGAPEWKTALSVTAPAALDGILTGFLLGLARASGETAPLLFTALGNDHFEVGRLISAGIAGRQSLATILGNVLDQPVDSLPLTLWKYAQQPFVERMDQSWAVALVLMAFVLLVNIVARWWVHARTARMKG